MAREGLRWNSSFEPARQRRISRIDLLGVLAWKPYLSPPWCEVRQQGKCLSEHPDHTGTRHMGSLHFQPGGRPARGIFWVQLRYQAGVPYTSAEQIPPLSLRRPSIPYRSNPPSHWQSGQPQGAKVSWERNVFWRAQRHGSVSFYFLIPFQPESEWLQLSSISPNKSALSLLQVSVLFVSGPSSQEDQSLMWDRDTATPPRQLVAKHERRTAERWRQPWENHTSRAQKGQKQSHKNRRAVKNSGLDSKPGTQTPGPELPEAAAIPQGTFRTQGKEEREESQGLASGGGEEVPPNSTQTEASLEHHSHPQGASSHCPQPGFLRSGIQHPSTGFGQFSPKLLGKD